MLDDSVARWGSPDGVLCAKLMWHPYRLAMLEQGVDMSHWGVPVTWVRITRDDRLGQAVSFARAAQTAQWTADEEAAGEATFRPDWIESSLQTIEESEECWDRYLAEGDIHPYTVTYEQFDSDYEGTVRALLDHLGYPPVGVPVRQLRRQAVDVSATWREQYLRWREATS